MRVRVNSRQRVLVGVLLVAVVFFYLSWNKNSNSDQLLTSKTNNASCVLDDFVLDPALDQTDPCLVAFVKAKMMVPPRPLGYVKTIPFSSSKIDVPSNIEKLKWVQMLVIAGAPKDTRFFFVDSGAHDGKFLSTTLRLETLFGWNGVLIEPLPTELQKIVENRRAWAVSAALCLTPHPEYINFNVQGAVSGVKLDGRKNGTKLKLPCVPLYTILAALNVTVVDYLSLDIEGAELLVLKTVPFDKVIFKIMTIEYNHLPGENQIGQLVEFMEPKGYHLVANISMDWSGSGDCLFVHESVYKQKKSMINYLYTI